MDLMKGLWSIQEPGSRLLSTSRLVKVLMFFVMKIYFNCLAIAPPYFRNAGPISLDVPQFY